MNGCLSLPSCHVTAAVVIGVEVIGEADPVEALAVLVALVVLAEAVLAAAEQEEVFKPWNS